METYYDKIAIFQQFLNLHEYRKKTKLTPYLNAFLDYSEQTIKSQYDKGWRKPNPKLKIFKDNLEDRLIEGKIGYVYQANEVYQNILQQRAIQQDIPGQEIVFDDAYTLSYTLHIWKRKTLKLSYQKGLLQIIKDKVIKQFHLQNYLIRQSRNNQYNCFVLQSLNTKVTDKNRTMRVGFKTILPFQQWFLAVKAVVIKMERISLRQELSKCPLFKQIQSNPIKPQISQTKLITKQKQQFPQQQQIIIDIKQKEDQQQSQDGDIVIKTVMNVALDESQVQRIERTSLLKTHANIFAVILPDYDLSTIQQQSDYSIVHQQNEAMILRNSTKAQRYKVILPTHQKNINKILSVLFNVSEYPSWNSGVESSTIKSAISSQNMVIIYQKNKQYNTIYRARDFIFLRHVFVKDQAMYVVDKSINNSDYPSSMFTVRGNIEAVWGIIKNSDNTFTVIIDITIQNQGLINDNQDHNISMEYLKGLLNLKSKIQNIQQISNNHQVFDLNWRIYTNEQATSDEIIKISPKIQQSHQKDTQNKRRKTVSQSAEKTETMTRRITVPQKPQSIIQNKLQILTLSQLPPPKFNTTIINYQFNSIGLVIIPQNYLNHKYLLSPSEPKQIILQEVINGHAIWKGQWRFDPNGGIVFINQTKIDHQKGVLKYVLSKIAKNLLSGKSILQISLPVDIFAPETNLERFAFSMTYAPIMLEKGFQAKTALEKFKWVVAFGITNSILYLNMQKPFNPILGQTFQGWINGCPIYLEQTSHHPPIASFLFLGRGYKITGSVQSKVQMQMNSGCGITDGVFRIQTDDGADFNFITPGGQISGLTFGDRRFNLVGKYYVWSKKYQLFVQVKLDPSAKGFFSKRQHPSDYMEGNIYQVKRQFLQDFQLKKKKDSPSKQKILNDLGKVSGIWSKMLTIDNQAYLDLDKDIGCKLQYDQYLLPSDGNWRQDVVYKKLSDNIKSQSEKQRLQNVQRNDRKLRESGKH